MANFNKQAREVTAVPGCNRFWFRFTASALAINLLIDSTSASASESQVDEKERRQFSRELGSLKNWYGGVEDTLTRKLNVAINYDFLSGGNFNEIIVCAAIKSHLNQAVFKKQYPEIWRRSAIVAIDDFDNSGERKILVRYFNSPGDPLQLRMLNPRKLRKTESFLVEGRIYYDWMLTSEAPIRVFKKKNGTFIEAQHETKPVNVDANGYRYIYQLVLLTYSGGAFKVVKFQQEERPEASWIPREKFFIHF